MFDWLSNNSTNAITLLKKDHDKVKDLFDRFEDAKGRAEKKKIVDQALMELKIHPTLEEEMFYPAVRRHVGQDLMNEADEEHHVAKILIAELDRMNGDEDHYDAKFTVLAESVRHHIKEEEGEMLPKAKDTSINFDELGEKMLRRKEQIMAKGVPPVAEEKTVAAVRGRGDSPAKAARKKPATRVIKKARTATARRAG